MSRKKSDKSIVSVVDEDIISDNDDLFDGEDSPLSTDNIDTIIGAAAVTKLNDADSIDTSFDSDSAISDDIVDDEDEEDDVDDIMDDEDENGELSLPRGV